MTSVVAAKIGFRIASLTLGGLCIGMGAILYKDTVKDFEDKKISESTATVYSFGAGALIGYGLINIGEAIIKFNK